MVSCHGVQLRYSLLASRSSGRVDARLLGGVCVTSGGRRPCPAAAMCSHTIPPWRSQGMVAPSKILCQIMPASPIMMRMGCTLCPTQQDGDDCICIRRAGKKFVDRSLSNEGGHPCLAWERYGDRCLATPVHLVALTHLPASGAHADALPASHCQCVLTVSLSHPVLLAVSNTAAHSRSKPCTVWRLKASATDAGNATHACSSSASAARWLWRHLSASLLPQSEERF
jgi:hypothetical protein